MRFGVRSLASLGGLKIHVAVSCSVGRRYVLDLALLWLCCRPAATALIRPLAWEPTCPSGAALKRQKTKKKKKKKKNKVIVGSTFGDQLGVGFVFGLESQS